MSKRGQEITPLISALGGPSERRMVDFRGALLFPGWNSVRDSIAQEDTNDKTFLDRTPNSCYDSKKCSIRRTAYVWSLSVRYIA
jgi:hypothetical protein